MKPAEEADTWECDAFDRPFPHWVARNLVPNDLLNAAFRQVPPAAWSRWVRYDNWAERKRTCRDPEHLPPAITDVLRLCCTDQFVEGLARLTGLGPFRPDTTFHGAGLHVMEPGGYLEPHLDSEMHPFWSGMERRLNLILFLNAHWDQRIGGALEFYEPDAVQPATHLTPSRGTAVLWGPSDLSYHGVQMIDPMLGVERVSLALYYWATARPKTGMPTRRRALFACRRNRQG